MTSAMATDGKNDHTARRTKTAQFPLAFDQYLEQGRDRAEGEFVIWPTEKDAH